MSGLAPFVPDPIPSLLRDRYRRVFALLPHALAGEEEAVHDMRVAARRLRVALPLLSAPGQERRVERALRLLRDLTRAAGQSRDLDVMGGLLDQHLARLGPPTKERSTLRRRLRAARARSRARMAETLLDLPIARLRRDLRRVLAHPFDGVFAVLARLRDAAAARGTQLIGEMAVVGSRFDADELHRMRRRVRRLRYVSELVESARGQEIEATVLFKGLQERLGDVRDAHLLAAWLERQARAAAARGHAALAEEAGRLQADFRSRADEHHQALLQGDPAAVVQRGLVALGAARDAA